MMAVFCSELATAFKVPTDLQNKCKQSVLRTMNQVNEKTRNGQACELWRDIYISNASIYVENIFFGTRYHFMAVVEQASWYWWTSGSLVKDMSPMLER